jgi:hypothetical protein
MVLRGDTSGATDRNLQLAPMLAHDTERNCRVSTS